MIVCLEEPAHQPYDCEVTSTSFLRRLGLGCVVYWRRGIILQLCLKPNITLLKRTQAHQMLDGRTAVGVIASGLQLNIWHKTGVAD